MFSRNKNGAVSTTGEPSIIIAMRPSRSLATTTSGRWVQPIVLKGENCLDQELLYDVYKERDTMANEYFKPYIKNSYLIAEFLSSTTYYKNKFYTWYGLHNE